MASISKIWWKRYHRDPNDERPLVYVAAANTRVRVIVVNPLAFQARHCRIETLPVVGFFWMLGLEFGDDMVPLVVKKTKVVYCGQCRFAGSESSDRGEHTFPLH